MTETELILETCGAYKYDTRGINLDVGGCFYLTEDGERKCAVGRCMTDEAIERFKAGGHCSGWGVSAITREFGPLDQFLKDDYKGFDLDLWVDLQRLHDDGDAWNETGLSDYGETVRDRLLEKHSKESKAEVK